MLRRISFLFVLILLSARVSAEVLPCPDALAKAGSSPNRLRLAQDPSLNSTLERITTSFQEPISTAGIQNRNKLMGDLLNLMNDHDPEGRSEAIVTGAKVLTQPSRFSLSPYHRWELIKALTEAIKKNPEVLKARSAELAILKDQAKTHAATAKPTIFSGSQAQITEADISRERQIGKGILERLENEVNRGSRNRTRAEADRHFDYANNMEGSKNLSGAWVQLNAVLIENQN